MPPSVQSYDDIYGGLASQYQPQTDLINTQLADLPRQQAAQQASLDQAKVNAFKDITNGANAKGVLFSGVPIDQQSTYVGTKYLPAVANMQTGFNNNRTSLQSALNTVNANRMTTARGIQSTQQANLTAYQKAQSDEAYKQAQLGLSYARLGAIQGNAGVAANKYAAAQAAQYKLGYKPNNNGLAFTGPNGVTSAYGYASGVAGGDPNGTYNAFVQALQKSPTTYDKNALMALKGYAIQGMNQGQALKLLQSQYGALF